MVGSLPFSFYPLRYSDSCGERSVCTGLASMLGKGNHDRIIRKLRINSFYHQWPVSTEGWSAEVGRLSYRNVQWFRGGLVCKARRLLHHPTLGLRVIKKKRGRSVIESFLSMKACEPMWGDLLGERQRGQEGE